MRMNAIVLTIVTACAGGASAQGVEIKDWRQVLEYPMCSRIHKDGKVLTLLGAHKEIAITSDGTRWVYPLLIDLVGARIEHPKDVQGQLDCIPELR